MALIIEPRNVRPGIGYAIRARSLDDAWAWVQRRPVWAWVDYDYSYERGPDVELRLEMSLNMPHWINKRSRPASERQEWDRFWKALLYHEEGHIAIIRRETPVMYRRMSAAARGAVEEVFEDETARIKGINDEYDRINRTYTQITPYGPLMVSSLPGAWELRP